MSFLNPAILWALLALSIPILIHLFHFRRYKKVYFSNVKFLREVKQERNNIRQLKRWLLLASRLLALFFLVTAFAQPFLKGKEKVDPGKNAVSIYFDNSHSMGLKYKGVELLEWGRDRCGEIISSYSEQDEFQVITNDLKVEEQRWKSKRDALNYLDNISITANSLTLSQVLDKQDYLFTKSNSDVLRRFMVSDFQESMVGDAVIREDSLTSNYLFHLQAEDIRNIYIDSVWMNEPVSRTAGNNAILYRIVNSSQLDAPGIRVTLEINEQVQGVRELNLIANEQRTDTLYFNIYKPGWQLGSVSITDYPITVDDIFYFSIPVRGKSPVLEVFEAGSPDIIQRIFQDDDYVEFSRNNSNRLNYSSFDQHQLIILNEPVAISSGLSSSLQKFLKSGGNVLLIPAPNPDRASYNEFLNSVSGSVLGELKTGNYKMARPNLSNVLLKNIVERYPENAIVPQVSKYYPLNTSTRTREMQLLSLNNNDALLNWLPLDNGNLFYQAVPADQAFTDFQRNWFYAPVIYNLALFQGLDRDLFVTSGQNKWIAIDQPIERKDDVVEISGPEMEFIPEQRTVNNRLVINSGKNEDVPAGHYSVEMNGQELAWLSYNTNRLESEMDFYDAAELKERFPNASEIASGMQETLVSGVKLRNEGRPLWRLCLILAIVFLIIEVAILKWLPD